MLEELERLRAYRAEVPEPDDASVAAARARLMEAIVVEPRSEGVRRARSQVAPARRPRVTRDRLRRLQRRRRFVLAGGLASVGVGVAGLLGFTTAAAPVSALAAQMNQLARVAASQAWTGIPGPGQYLYTESDGLTSSSIMGNDKECTVSQVEHRQIWIATNGSGAINDTRDQSKFTSPADQAICANDFKVTDPSTQNSSWSNRFPVNGLSFPTNDWKSLSTDPRTLLKQVHQLDGGPNTPSEWFTNITDFLRESDVPPAIRAALYQALPLIPGIKLMGVQTDPTGQVGLGVGAYSDGQLRAELIFDQQSARMLAEEYFDSTGKLVDWYSYIAQKIVDTLPNYPMAKVGPANPPQQLSSAGTSGNATSASTPSTTTTAATQSSATTTG